MKFNLIICFIIQIFSSFLYADSFKYNSYNNHGVIGLINMPTARFYNESVHGITVYNGSPDKKITLTSNPYDWLEASFFYTSIEDRPYCFDPIDPICRQDYKDKGFNFKLRIKEEGNLPSIAIGINDIAGTGFYSSEYIVSSYGINNFDLHFGMAWGTINGSRYSFKNPLGYLYDEFNNRPVTFADKGGQFQPSRYFSGKDVSPFFGISYALSKNILIKVENDTTATPGIVGYANKSSDYSYGIEYSLRDNFTFGMSYERGNYLSFKFIYKNNPIQSKRPYEYKKAEYDKGDNKYDKLIKNLEKNGIGVNKIFEGAESIGIELTQFAHPNLQLVEQIIKSSTKDAQIDKGIKTELKIANLTAVSDIEREFFDSAEVIYERKKTRRFNTKNSIRFRPFLASREEFFKGALVFENDSEVIFTDSLLLNTNIKYTLADNFSDLRYPPKDTFPAQVRSDVKQYLKNMNDGILIGRAQLDYHFTPYNNHHLMFSGGILEDMFSGYGFEYLYYKHHKNYAIGFESFHVKKRDYQWRFGTLDYENVTSSINFYYRNYGYIPFDAKISYGEYLAGDIGSTIELSRTFQNGTQFGVFASFTDVSAEDFGEGTFDKGIFFNIPVYGNFINYTWRPLTKDPGAKLNRRHTLYDLLVKFRPLN